MPTVSKQHFQQGTSLTATQLNSAYVDLETESAVLDDTNTASGWATLAHFNSSSDRCNRLYEYSYTGSGTDRITSSSYVTVNTGVPAELSLTGFFPDKYEATRFVCSGLVREVAVAGATEDVGVKNYYAFRLLLTYSDGGGPDTPLVIGEWGYSLTPRSRVTNQNTSQGDDIQYQTFQFSAVRRFDGTTGNREYKSLELQCKINNTSNSVDISRHQLFAISARR